MPQDIYPTYTFGGREYWGIPNLTLVDKDPDGEVYFFLGTPQGNRANVGPLLRGDRGLSPIFVEGTTTELEYGDATPASTTPVLVDPGDPDADVPPTYAINVVRHKGQNGTNGASVLNPASFGTAVYRRLLQVNSAATGFEYTPQKVGDQRWPTSVTEAPSGTTSSYTVATIVVAANTFPFDWRPSLKGISFVSATTSDTVVDLVARLDADDGVILGLTEGLPGLTDRLVLAGGPTPGATSTTGKIAANAAATLKLRLEKQGGAGTFQSGVLGATRFSMDVIAVL